MIDEELRYLQIDMAIHRLATICNIFPTRTNFPSSGGSMTEAFRGVVLGNVLHASTDGLSC